VNPIFRHRTPGSRWWFGSSPKLNSLVPGPCLPHQEIWSKSVHNCFSYLTDRQTDRQTNRLTKRNENITSFGRGNNPTNTTNRMEVTRPQQIIVVIIMCRILLISLSCHYTSILKLNRPSRPSPCASTLGSVYSGRRLRNQLMNCWKRDDDSGTNSGILRVCLTHTDTHTCIQTIGLWHSSLQN